MKKIYIPGLIIVAWLIIPQERLILFLLEHVFTIANLFMSVLTVLVYIMLREQRLRDQKKALKDFTYRDSEPTIAENFRERIKR